MKWEDPGTRRVLGTRAAWLLVLMLLVVVVVVAWSDNQNGCEKYEGVRYQACLDLNYP